MEKIKITNHQLGALTAIATAGTGIIIISGNMAKFAKQDAWIAAIAGILLGAAVIAVHIYLGSLHPDKTYLEIFRYAFGKWIGNLFILAFLFLCFIAVTHISHFMAAFMVLQYLEETPYYAIDLLIVIVYVIALQYGIETIVRSSESFVYLISFLFLLSMGLVFPNIKVDNLLPVLEEGIKPVIAASLYLISYIAFPNIVIGALYPNMKPMKGAGKAMLIGYFVGSLSIFTVVIMSMLVLGSAIVGRVPFPTYLLAKEINVGEVLTRLEGVVARIWAITLFYKALLYFYNLVIGTSILFGLKEPKKIVLPYALLILILMNIVLPDAFIEEKFNTVAWPYFIGTFGGVMPIILIIITKIKRSKSTKTNN